MAALGAETASGDFEVFEYCYAGLPHQPPLQPTTPEGEWVAIASGVEMGTANDVADARAEMLAEWLLGESGEDEVRLLQSLECLDERAKSDDVVTFRTAMRRLR